MCCAPVSFSFVARVDVVVSSGAAALAASRVKGGSRASERVARCAEADTETERERRGKRESQGEWNGRQREKKRTGKKMRILVSV